MAAVMPGRSLPLVEQPRRPSVRLESAPTGAALHDAERARPVAWTLAAFAFLVGAYFLDVASGNEVSSSLFYVIGIATAAWFAGREMGMLVSLLSTVAWGVAVKLVGPGFSKASVFYWNLAVELAVYLTIAIALDRVHRGIRNERRLAERIALAHQALERDAKAVGDLQREMLPPGPPRVRGYEFQMHYATSTQAGGDYYDFFSLPGGRTGVFVGDASGHGPQAAVLMAMLRVLLHTTTEALTSPARVLSRLGRQIARTVPDGRFATACYAVLDPASGHIDFSLAGHPPPLILRREDGALEELPMCGGPPLGLLTESVFAAGATTLRPGDTLILYTDGLTEGMSPTRELFGEDGFRQALEGAEGLPLAVLRDRVLVGLAAHTAGAALEDDLTLLMLRRVG